MAALALVFFALTVAEIWVLIQVGSVIGAGDTIVLMIVVSIAGAWLVKRQGVGIVRRVGEEMRAGRMPGKELVDGALVLAAAVMLLTPGFITDSAALLLLLPPVRAAVRGWGRRWIAKKIRLGGPHPGSRFGWEARANPPPPPVDAEGYESGGPEDPPQLSGGDDERPRA